MAPSIVHRQNNTLRIFNSTKRLKSSRTRNIFAAIDKWGKCDLWDKGLIHLSVHALNYTQYSGTHPPALKFNNSLWVLDALGTLLLE